VERVSIVEGGRLTNRGFDDRTQNLVQEVIDERLDDADLVFARGVAHEHVEPLGWAMAASIQTSHVLCIRHRIASTI